MAAGLTERVTGDLQGELSRLVELGDLDELTRLIDRLGSAGDWDGLVHLRDRCRAALERGKQLWPAASLAETERVFAPGLSLSSCENFPLLTGSTIAAPALSVSET